MIRLVIVVDDITEVMNAGYTHIRVYYDAMEDGDYTDLDGSVPLSPGDTGYQYVDLDGMASLWYKVAYYGEVPGESDKTAARKGDTFSTYGTVTELKRRLDIEDDDSDSTLALILGAASRMLDRHVRRRFYTSAVDETRYFTARNAHFMFVGDIVSVTSMSTDTNGDGTYNNTWETTDYHLEPYNAALENEPYSKIQVATLGTNTFPTGIYKGVKVVGKFGWPEVPEAAREWSLMVAAKLWFRKDAVFGIVKGAPELGEVRKIITEDPELKLVIYGLRDYGKII